MSIISTTGTISRSEDDANYTVFQQANFFRQAEMLLGNIFLGINQSCVMVFNDHGIPPRSKILSAKLFFTCSRSNGAQVDVDFFALGGDPSILNRKVWSDDTFDGWRPSVWGRFNCNIQDPFSSFLFISDPVFSAGSWAINFEAEKKRSLGALFSIPTTDTLGFAGFVLSRIGNPSGNLFSSVYIADINGLPTGPALATSDAVAASSLGIGAANRGLINFTYSGGDQITLLGGVNYVSVIEEPSYPITGTDFIQWHERRAFFSVGISKHLGIGRQFDYQNFPLHGDVSLTANFQRISSGINWNMPTFVTGFELNTGLTDLSPVIQACVDENGYTAGRRIAIVIAAVSEASNRAFASFDNVTFAPPRLEITYELDPDGWLPPQEIPTLPIYNRAVYQDYQIDPASAGTEDLGLFAKKAHIFIPGATEAKVSQQITRRSIFFPGATQAKLFKPGVKRATIFLPIKQVGKVNPPGATQAKVYIPGVKQANVSKPITRRAMFVPGATQAKTFTPGITKARVFIPGTTKGTTL